MKKGDILIGSENVLEKNTLQTGPVVTNENNTINDDLVVTMKEKAPQQESNSTVVNSPLASISSMGRQK